MSETPAFHDALAAAPSGRTRLLGIPFKWAAVLVHLPLMPLNFILAVLLVRREPLEHRWIRAQALQACLFGVLLSASKAGLYFSSGPWRFLAGVSLLCAYVGFAVGWWRVVRGAGVFARGLDLDGLATRTQSIPARGFGVAVGVLSLISLLPLSPDGLSTSPPQAAVDQPPAVSLPEPSSVISRRASASAPPSLPMHDAPSPTVAEVPEVPAQTSTPTPAEDPFVALSSSSIDVDEFESRMHGKEWAFFDRVVQGCESDDGPTYPPPGETEFDRRASAEGAPQIREDLMGKIVRFHGSDQLTGVDEVFDTVDISHRFELSRSSYDFRRHRYRVNVVANSDLADARWPICLRGECQPDIRASSYQEEVDRAIGHIGSREVTIRSTETEVEWQNFSRISIDVPLEETVARGLGASMPVDMTILLRFAGVGHHKRCHRSCDVMFGERVCSSGDEGFGLFYRAELVGYQLRMGGSVVAQYIH